MGQLHHHIPCTQGVPGSIYVCIQILLGGLAGADAIARVIIREDVAVDASAEANVETAHLAEVNCIAVGEKHRKPAGMIQTKG